MKPSKFTYHAPRSVTEALDMLAEHGAEGKVLAGGQSLMPVLAMRLAAPEHLIDINRLESELGGVEVDDEGATIGALVRHAGLARHERAYERVPLLRQALQHVAHPAIRNRGTTVGSLTHADPAAEMPAVLAARRLDHRPIRAGRTHHRRTGLLHRPDGVLVAARRVGRVRTLPRTTGPGRHLLRRVGPAPRRLRHGRGRGGQRAR